MSKLKKNKPKKESGNVKESFFESLPVKYQNIIAVIIIALPLIIYFAPWMSDGVRPVGTDIISSEGQTHRWVEWSNETGETALWNPSIFGGEPIYPRITPNLLHIDTLLRYLDRISYWVFLYLFLGGLGLFLFMKYKKIPWYLAIIVAVAFILLPDWQAQIGEGHNSKLRAIMTLPWVFLSFSYFFDKKNWLGAGLFAFSFSWLVRTHHFQIVFYGILVLFILYIYPTVKLLIDKKYKETIHLFLKFSAALILTLMTTAQPLFTTNEYAKFTTRGGDPVKIGEQAKSAVEGGGVSFEYATQWSFSPRELMSFFIPRFNGGLQREIYDGDKYQQFRGRQVPGYWGDKPFNGNYASVGMILFLFAIIGVVFYRKDPFVISLAVFTVISILLSFGRHFPELYKLFFYYVPYFSKFRAPAMIVNITFITVLILSGYGLKGIITEFKTNDIKWLSSLFVGALVVVGAIWMMSGSFSYTIPAEAQRYDANTMNVLKDIRQEFLVADAKKLFLFLIIASAVLGGYLLKKIKLEAFVVMIFIISFIEIFSISNRAHGYINLDNPDKLKESVFKATPITDELSKADPSFRAIALGQDFTDNYYAYYYPIINGYSAIKLQVIQDVIANNLFNAQTADKVNWNFINMMGGKYVISSSQLVHDSLSVAAIDKDKKQVLFLNPEAFPKAWFVKNVKSFAAPESLVLYMNDPGFNPADEALAVNFNDRNSFSGSGEVKLISQNPNQLKFSVNTDEEQFLTVSEIFFPEGWTAKIDEEELSIYQVNHVLRGVKVPAGEYTLVFEFHPNTYFASLTSLWIGDILILLIIIWGAFQMMKKEKSR